MAIYVIPGQNPVKVEHLVLDFNGALAVDGVLVPGVAERLRELALTPHGLAMHVVTADTNASARRQLDGLPCVVPRHLFSPGPLAQSATTGGHLGC